MDNEMNMWDFGFTAMNADELEVVQEAKAKAVAGEETEEKLNKLHNAILPLLANLKKDPSRKYIYWPNRVGKIEEFEKFLENIIK